MMNNEPRRILCVLGASALLMGSAAFYSRAGTTVETGLPAPVGTQAAAVPAPAYLVRDHNGLVAVFSGDGAELLRMTDAPVAALPALDRQNLQAGIPIEDDRSLAMLLEDLQ